MKKFLRYLRTIKNYWNSPKGRFDILDYGKAIVIFIVMVILTILIIKMGVKGDEFPLQGAGAEPLLGVRG